MAYNPNDENPRKRFKRFKAELPNIPEIPEDHDASGGHDASSGYDVSGGHDAHAPVQYYHPGCIFSMPLHRIRVILDAINASTSTIVPTAMQFARDRIAWNNAHHVSPTENERWDRWLTSPNITEKTTLHEFLQFEKVSEHV